MDDDDESVVEEFEILEPGTLESFLGSVDEPQVIHDDVYGDIIVEEVLDEPVEATSTEGSSVGDGACAVCGAPTFRPPGLTKTGRKRKAPKYCDLHTPHARVSERGNLSEGLDVQLQRVQEELADDVRLLAALAGPLLPVTGYYIYEAADPFTIAILKLARNNNRVLRILHRAASIAPVYTVGQTVAGVAYSVQVDTRGADPHNTLSKRLGVERAFKAVYPSDDVQTSNNGSTNGYQPPPRYATIP